MAVPELHIDVAAVDAHATKVDEIADMLDQVTAAAGYLDQQDSVYGEFPSLLILPILNIVQEYAVQDLRAGTDATAHLADVLRSITVEIGITDNEAAHVIGFQEGRR
ncbi:hypothetical protein GCM10010112_88870 [Actinoplanes lobatus]|uniref:Uncharacterized protein n=1 Tax=Actinoplanes lobatus TaxID=113568 RepID=A0A7W7HQR2_9ACTN|nr:hypothetical protein [Actinoplanes lobatus]MBB4754929.1 hypothetical protein [Actinoplanes lobatus]GGN97040.1 hypothetical protein GCM10010112_88870 [Actinoplanes lobatus]GIE44541.1 hypothetical protein Alo02nite_74390 [Actinoplanes lobatus]